MEYGNRTNILHCAQRNAYFELGDRGMEMGIGIHEPGRSAWLSNRDEITEMLALSITENSSIVAQCASGMSTKRMGGCGTEDPPFQSGDRVPAFAECMGGTFELYIVYRKPAEICQQQGLQVRNLVGPYITS